MQYQLERQQELADEKLEYILKSYPNIKDYSDISKKLWDIPECPICKSLFNHEKLKSNIMFCDNCNQTIEEIEIELKSEHEAQKKEDLENHISDIFEGLL